MAAAVLVFCAKMAGSQHTLINVDAQLALQTLTREPITFTDFAPTTIRMLRARADFENYDLSSLEVLLYGGSLIPEPVLRDAMNRLPNCGVVRCYEIVRRGQKAGFRQQPQLVLTIDGEQVK